MPVILHITSRDRYATIEDLFKRSQSDSVYYTFLFLSSVIIAAGLLFNSITVMIGGMLVTPLLTPLLLLSLGISVGEFHTIRKASILLLQSIFVVIGVSFLISIIFGGGVDSVLLGDSLRVAMLYFFVALVAGVAATFGWARKESADILPGVAVAVAFLPPLAMIGISLSGLDFETLRLALWTFTFNIVGVLLGSMIVFSLLKFYKTGRVIEHEAIHQEEQKKETQEAAVAETKQSK